MSEEFKRLLHDVIASGSGCVFKDIGVVPITTTLAKIRKHGPCEYGWKKLYKSLGGIKKYGEHTPLRFSQILESNGLDDALWCLRGICPEHDKEVRLYAADCAESVLHIYEKRHPEDDRPRKAIQAVRDFAEGKITDQELAAARAAAGAAARDAARDAAGYAAGAAARDAARAAARAAAMAAAGYAAGAAEKELQKKMLIERFG